MKTVVIKEKTHSRLKKASEIQKRTMSAIIDKAIDTYVDKIEYGPDGFSRFIDESPKLSPYAEIIKKESSHFATSLYKSIIQLKDKCNEDIEFLSMMLPKEAEDFKKFFGKSLLKLFIIVESGQSNYTNAQKEYKEIVKLIESFGDGEGDEFSVGMALKPNLDLEKGTNRLLIFYCSEDRGNKLEGKKSDTEKEK